MIDFVSCFEPQSLAVDAATMLEAFHSYAYELYLIGKEQGAGSKRQQAVFNWPSGSSTGATAPG